MCYARVRRSCFTFTLSSIFVTGVAPILLLHLARAQVCRVPTGADRVAESLPRIINSETLRPDCKHSHRLNMQASGPLHLTYNRDAVNLGALTTLDSVVW